MLQQPQAVRAQGVANRDGLVCGERRICLHTTSRATVLSQSGVSARTVPGSGSGLWLKVAEPVFFKVSRRTKSTRRAAVVTSAPRTQSNCRLSANSVCFDVFASTEYGTNRGARGFEDGGTGAGDTGSASVWKRRIPSWHSMSSAGDGAVAAERYRRRDSDASAGRFGAWTWWGSFELKQVKRGGDGRFESEGAQRGVLRGLE